MKNVKNDFIYKLKGIAIISVVCAHCGNRVSYTFLDNIINEIRGNIATIGVPLFFIISGYLFHNDKPYVEFWKRKWSSTIVPWIFWGTLVWAYEVIRKGLSYAKLLEWLFGIGTYLWYMRTLVIFWALLYFVKTHKIKVYVFIISLMVRIILYDVLKASISNIIIEDFLLNLPLFALGTLLSEVQLSNVKQLINKHIFCIPFLILIPLIVNNHRMSYSPPLFLIYICGCLLVALILIEKTEKCKYLADGLVTLGKHSYLIYLIHMPIAGLMSNLFSRNSILLYFALIQPIIVLIISEYAVKFIEIFGKKYRIVAFTIGIKKV